MAGIDVHRVEGGRLAEHWHVVDQLALLQQLGVLPSLQPA
jgi:predicted ester cyclase